MPAWVSSRGPRMTLRPALTAQPDENLNSGNKRPLDTNANAEGWSLRACVAYVVCEPKHKEVSRQQDECAAGSTGAMEAAAG